MKKTILILTVLLTISLESFSQYTPGVRYLHLVNDSIVYGTEISLEKKLFSRSVLIDNHKFKQSEVKFYVQYSQIHANLRHLSPFKTNYFARCISKGKLNLFISTTTSYNMETGSIRTSTDYFYNKNFEEVKKLHYKNLKVDLKDNPECLIILNKSKKLTTWTKIALIGGASLIVVPFLNIIFQPMDGKLDKVAIACAPVGVVSILISNPLRYKTKKNNKKAFDVYNN